MRKLFYRFVYAILSARSPKTSITFLQTERADLYGNITAVAEKTPDHLKRVVTGTGTRTLFRDIAALRTIAASRVLVADTMNYFISILPVSDKTAIVFAGHAGGALKKMAFAAHAAEPDNPKSFRKMADFYGKVDYVLSSSAQIEQELVENYRLPASHILALGVPRTDSLFSLDPEAIRAACARTWPRIAEKKTVLYAPTFRNRRGRRSMPIELDPAVFERLTGGAYTVLFRGHPTVRPPALPEGWIDVSGVPYLDVLAISDILVTDFSSILFDFAFFRRPIFMLVTDEAAYRRGQRDVWQTPSNLVGERNVCRSTADLAGALVTMPANDQPHRIWERFMDACDGRSAGRVSEFLVHLAQSQTAEGSARHDRLLITRRAACKP